MTTWTSVSSTKGGLIRSLNTLGNIDNFWLVKNLKKIWRQNKFLTNFEAQKNKVLFLFGRKNLKMSEKCGAKM